VLLIHALPPVNVGACIVDEAYILADVTVGAATVAAETVPLISALAPVNVCAYIVDEAYILADVTVGAATVAAETVPLI